MPNFFHKHNNISNSRKRRLCHFTPRNPCHSPCIKSFVIRTREPTGPQGSTGAQGPQGIGAIEPANSASSASIRIVRYSDG